MLAGAKPFVARQLTHPAVGWAVSRAFSDRVPNGGLRFDTSSPYVPARVKAALALGLYERAELALLRANLRADLDVVELGGSIGVVGSHAGRRLEAGRRICSVEAHPGLVPVLRANLEANLPHVEVEVIHGAIDYSGDEEVELALGESSTGGRVAEAGAARSASVPAVTLTDVLDRAGMESEFTLVADIEGAEADMLAAEGDVLTRCPQILLEMHSRTVGGTRRPAEEMLDLARSLGYSVRDRRGPVVLLER